MTYFADGAPCTYFDTDPQRLRAVGWLDAEHPFTTGTVAAATFQRLVTFVRDPWECVIFKGWHRCELCPASSDPFTRFAWQGQPVAVGITNVFIPADGFLWVAPSMIVHYIADHGYRPPGDFLAAVDACPPMTSPAYRAAIDANGPSWSEPAGGEQSGTSVFGNR